MSPAKANCQRAGNRRIGSPGLLWPFCADAVVRRLPENPWIQFHRTCVAFAGAADLPGMGRARSGAKAGVSLLAHAPARGMGQGEAETDILENGVIVYAATPQRIEV